MRCAMPTLQWPWQAAHHCAGAASVDLKALVFPARLRCGPSRPINIATDCFLVLLLCHAGRATKCSRLCLGCLGRHRHSHIFYVPLLCSPVLPLEHYLDVGAALGASQSNRLSYLGWRFDRPTVHLNDNVTLLKVDIGWQWALRVKVSD